MLSMTTKRGTSKADVGKVADYPDEHKDKEKQVGSIEDYYSQGSDKTPSKWLGGAAAALGLEGPVSREDHIKTLQALDPKTGEKLVSTAGEARRYAWDMTFSAPKSVSIVWAIGSEDTKRAVEAAQARAVEKVLTHIEENFALSRRGSSEKDTIVFEKAKLLAAAFLHGSSREQDPQLHTHLMLQNLLQREDGTFGTLEPKELFEWKMALGAIFRAELAAEMAALGFEIEADGESFKLVGIPKELEEEFSKRRQQIEASLEKSGFSGGKASEMAALDTRKGKEVLDSDVLKGDWKARAQAHGVTMETIENLRVEPQKPQAFTGLSDEETEKVLLDNRFSELNEEDREDIEMFLRHPDQYYEAWSEPYIDDAPEDFSFPNRSEYIEERLESLGLSHLISNYNPLNPAEVFKKLTSMESVFQEKDLFRVVAVEMSHRGRGLDDVRSAVENMLSEKDLVKLRGKDGKTYYTTREILTLEKSIISSAIEGKEDRSHVLERDIIANAISRREIEQGFKFSPEQRAGVEFLTESAGSIKIVQGHAGAGKSTALVPVRYAYEAAGYEVIGASLQGKTAKLMQEETGIKSQTIAKLLIDLEGYHRDDGTFVPPSRELSEKSVVVVDEAMMCDTRTLARLQGLTAKAGAGLRLVGDVAQVPPVGAGNPVKSLMKELGFIELTENRRQKTEWQNSASREIRDGHIKEALVEYGKQGRIDIAETREEGMKLLIEKWASDPTDRAKAILTAYRNEDVHQLNTMARSKMQEEGLLQGIRAEVKTSTGISEFQAGDRIFFSGGSKKSHGFEAGSVTNGETGTLYKIEQNDKQIWQFHVKMDDGKTVIFDPKKYDLFRHGYAVTINKSQGATVEKSFNYVGLQGLEQFYVQMTRHKQDAHLVMASDQISLAADRLGVDLKPTEKMLKFAENVAKKEKIDLPAYCREDFDACRTFLNERVYKIEKLEEKEPDYDLEKISSLIKALETSHEKMNALDFEVEVEEEPYIPGTMAEQHGMTEEEWEKEQADLEKEQANHVDLEDEYELEI